jgi:hypothetical protein
LISQKAGIIVYKSSEEQMSEFRKLMKLMFDAQDFFRDPQMEAVVERFASLEKRDCLCPCHKFPDEPDTDV